MLKDLPVVTAATDTGKTTIVVNAVLPTGHHWYYDTATTVAGLIGVTYGTAITTGNWTQLTANGTEITPTSGDLYIRVVDVDASNYPIAVGDALINIG